MRKGVRLGLVVALLGGVAAFSVPARGEGDGREELAAAVKRGKELWERMWSPVQKNCTGCHASGPNKLIAPRVKSYPKWDKTAGKVISAQQKIAQMVKEKCGGTAPELGSDDLNALEAFVSTLR